VTIIDDTRDVPTLADLPPAEARERAQQLWRDSGGTLRAPAAAERFGMSERWWRNQINAVAGTNGNGTTAGAARPAVPNPRAAARGGVPPAERPRINGTARPARPEPPAPRAAARHKAPARHWVDTVTVLAVALVAAAASYGHMLEVAQLAGEPVWLARAFPITVDGLALAALRRGTAGRWWLVFALAVSVAGNVLAQFPDAAATAGPAVSAWPPLALYGTHRLLQGGR
jgi:hypothetical protein